MTCEGCSGAINRVLKKAKDADGECLYLKKAGRSEG